jgi:tetratricopeptide (TPR) repeat protein
MKKELIAYLRQGKAKRLDTKLKDLRHFRIIKHILISIFLFLGLTLIVYSFIDSKRSRDRNLHAKNSMAILHCDKALIYFDQGKFDMAKFKYMKPIELNPNSFRAYHGLALCYGKLCSESDTHCVNAMKVIDKIKEKFPNENISDLEELEFSIKKKFEIYSQ